MKKPLLSIDEPEPKKATRADRPPVEGFATIVDGHFKSEFDTAEAAEAAGRVASPGHWLSRSGIGLLCRSATAADIL